MSPFLSKVNLSGNFFHLKLGSTRHYMMMQSSVMGNLVQTALQFVSNFITRSLVCPSHQKYFVCYFFLSTNLDTQVMILYQVLNKKKIYRVNYCYRYASTYISKTRPIYQLVYKNC